MEAIPESTHGSAETTSRIVKREDGSAQNDGGRSSPPPNCAICLGRCRNKSFTDSCLHQFCFKCLLTWSKVKTECPLCKQNFKSIIHNVQSDKQYEEYPVQQTQSSDLIDPNDIVNATRRFRYRTTLTLPRRETLAIQQFLLHYPLSALIGELPAVAERRRSTAHFRRTVYRHNLWSRPLPDFTGRFRNCSPEFFRYNESQMHRLVPWLNRELFYLLNENTGHISYVRSRILELLPQYRITSPEFGDAMRCYFGERTEHFLHEFNNFACTPYDMTGYDRNVQYQTDSRISSVVNEVLSSSDSDASRDSDIVMVSSSHPAPAPAPAPADSVAGPSRPQHASAPAPVYPRHFIPQPDTVVPIETVSHSDTDSDSSVMVVGYIKPPHQRTPEQVDLLASDSDVVVQEDPPAPAPAPAPSAAPPLVRLTLSRSRAAADRSDSEREGAASPPQTRARRARRRREATPPPSPSTTPPLPRRDAPDASRDASESRRSPASDSDDSTASSSSSDIRRDRPPRPRPRYRRGSRGSRRSRDDGDDPRRSAETRTEGRRSRRRSESRKRKGVERSRRGGSTAGEGASGTEAGPSGLRSRKRRGDGDGSRRPARDRKRQKRAVNLLQQYADKRDRCMPLRSVIRRARDQHRSLPHGDGSTSSSSSSSSTAPSCRCDSDRDSDDIPLRDTIDKSRSKRP